jgi:ATP-dependent RNA helicase RhlE
MTDFKGLGLSEPILRGIREAGYSTPTPIQLQAIPVVLEGGDITGCAQTGTGKTAAFVLPMLQRLGAAPSGRRVVRALVVAPTRELAIQVEESVQTYGRYTGLKSTTIYGGVGMEPQVRQLRNGVDIVIATPGRLLDHMGRRTLDLSNVEILVLDEADRMFDIGFINDVRKIVAAVRRERQTLLFSATMPPEIETLARTIQYKPVMVEIGQRRSPAETVTQHVYSVAGDQKLDLLLHVLQSEPVDSVLVFSRTKHRADRITKKLSQAGVSAVAIHGNRTQNQRQRALTGFKDGQFQVLVATDIAARGIDVDGISHVINFDTPNQAEDYIHRIGRTGRANATGIAMTFVSRDEEDYLRQIERFTGNRLERAAGPAFVRAESGPSSNGNGHGAGNRPSNQHANGQSRRRPARGRA